MRIVGQRSTVSPTNFGWLDNEEQSHEEGRHHQKDENNIDGDRDLQLAGVEVQAECHYRPERSYWSVSSHVPAGTSFDTTPNKLSKPHCMLMKEPLLPSVE